ncbi:MAG: hypothetical protein HC919_01240 [Oscillatoriales cyanobacterium SM2_2_1]|nr:hypothetical protein [Oscillatoriales cyanobacterium SM2_2_1]
MAAERIKEQVVAIAQQREVLIRLSKLPNLGTLAVDVIQAIEEMDDLLSEFKRTFPDCVI